MDCVITGAGIAGLTMALVLEKASAQLGERWSIQVFEMRNEQELSSGHSILLSLNGMCALRSLDPDLAAKIEAKGCIIREIKVYDQAGVIKLPQANINNPIVGLSIHRSDLVTCLKTQLKSSQIKYSTRVSGIHRENGTLVLQMAKPTQVTGLSPSVIFGCDGAASNLRKACCPGLKMTENPIYELVSSLHASEEDSKWTFEMSALYKFYNREARVALGILRTSPTKITWFLQFVAEDYQHLAPFDFKELAAELLQVTGFSEKEWLLSSTSFDKSYLSSTMDMDAPSSQFVTKDGVKIIFVGDAAHPFSPMTSQGAAMAFEDAALLYNMLLKYGAGMFNSIETLEEFSSLRKGRINKALQSGREMLQIFLNRRESSIPFCSHIPEEKVIPGPAAA